MPDSLTPPSKPVAQERPMTVSQLTRAGKNLLETYLPRLWVEGELSNVSKPSSGHWYFTIKDPKAQVRCAMFRNRNIYARIQPEAGQKVLLRAKASLYEGRGDFQLIVDEIQPAGQGDLQRAFDELKAKLLKQGWFDASIKKPLPPWPKRIVVLTSPTGAVIHDIARVLARRCSSIEVNILPIAVQGKNAAPDIVNALRQANEQQTNGAYLGELIVLARGGGSLEDLWAFNEESVARAIYESELPVVSAIGHEVDFTIADFMADVRAPTPSVAAELVSPDIRDIQTNIQRLRAQLFSNITQVLSKQRQQLRYFHARLKHPGERLQARAQKIDFLETRLYHAIAQKKDKSQQELKKWHNQLNQMNPKITVKRVREQLGILANRMPGLMQQRIKSKQKDLHHNIQRLNTLSPLNTLERGYAIVEDKEGHLVKNVNSVKKDSLLKTRLADGFVHSKVTSTETLKE